MATVGEGANALAWGKATAWATLRDALPRRQLVLLVALTICAALGCAVARSAYSRRALAMRSLREAAQAASAKAAQALSQAGQYVLRAEAAEARAREAEAGRLRAEAALQEAQRTLAGFAGTGLLEEIMDVREAERLGVARALGRMENPMRPDDQRRLLAALIRAARKDGFDPLLLAAVIHVESRFDPYAVSSVGARGLMQLMPATANWLLSSGVPMKPTALFNGPLNVELGSRYLRQMMDRFDGDLSLALVAYNAGPRVARSLKPHSKAWKRLQGYPHAVLAEYRHLVELQQDSGRQVANL
ncbi:MAG TPA: lytic transglycosylase domain-containing protein [Myxococcales bacterium]|jgi:soluble lytic murein transglycosylase-like protein|nr:lytic transglycosylase domain-containing protein [Myxococcales bacterium]